MAVSTDEVKLDKDIRETEEKIQETNLEIEDLAYLKLKEQAKMERVQIKNDTLEQLKKKLERSERNLDLAKKEGKKNNKDI